MPFLKHRLQAGLKALHFLGKFCWGQIDIFDFDLKILPGGEAVFLFLDLLVADSDAEILHGLTRVEGVDDPLDLRVGKDGTLVVVHLHLAAQLAGVHQEHVAGMLFINKQHGHVGAGVGKDIAGHAHHAPEPVMIHQMLADFQRDAAARRQKARGHHHGSLSLVIQGSNNMLEEHLVHGHAVQLFVGNIGHAGKETLLVGFPCQGIPGFAEIHVEGRIAGDIVKGGNIVLPGVQVPGRYQGVIMHHVGQRMHQAVEDQVQAHELVGLLADVLSVHGAVVLPDLMGQGQHQGAGAGGRV